jgi:hypothetical protein
MSPDAPSFGAFKSSDSWSAGDETGHQSSALYYIDYIYGRRTIGIYASPQMTLVYYYRYLPRY